MTQCRNPLVGLEERESAWNSTPSDLKCAFLFERELKTRTALSYFCLGGGDSRLSFHCNLMDEEYIHVGPLRLLHWQFHADEYFYTYSQFSKVCFFVSHFTRLLQWWTSLWTSISLPKEMFASSQSLAATLWPPHSALQSMSLPSAALPSLQTKVRFTSWRWGCEWRVTSC